MKNKIIAQILTFGLIFPAPLFAQDSENINKILQEEFGFKYEE